MSRTGALRSPYGALVVAALLATAAAPTDASARARHHHHHHAAATGSYEPSYSSIVVDANSGAVMQATNADSPRHPASLTKIMTLYLLFERLEAGKIKLTTEMQVSPHAAVQAPSKLGLQPGQTIAVETAIRAIVTKSANDVAVVVAEALAGDEADFAKLMTAKARALGMMHTTYHNASGLPDDLQMTTARDQALLGRAIQERFPKFYSYFSTRYFAYQGRMIRNHNHLLGSIDGVDGIKTGYIHDSGFNIVTSVRRNGRHIIAVMFGGHTAAARDARVRSMIDNNINIAAIKRTAPPVIEGREIAEARAKDVRETPAREKVASAAPITHRSEPALGSTDPIKPNRV
jgi:D-alanyl-D-alanine carboxypeptidase